MDDFTLELIALISIIAGLIIGFFLVFNYTPMNAFFLEEDDDNSYIEGYVLQKNVKTNYTLLKIYGCRSFDAYSEIKIDKKVNDSLIIMGSFSDNLFIVESYK